eukprot:scaffold195648_cov26-Tisochrysis_lutea.AAC.2
MSTAARCGKGTLVISPSERPTMTAPSDWRDATDAAASRAISRTVRGNGGRSTTAAACRVTGSHSITLAPRAIAMWPDGSRTAPTTPDSVALNCSSTIAHSCLSQSMNRTRPLDVMTSITSPSSQMADCKDPTLGDGCISPTDDPAKAASIKPLCEKISCWNPPVVSALVGKYSLVAVWSQAALCSGWEILSWFAEPSAKVSPSGPQSPHVIPPLCLPAKCLRDMKVWFDAKSHTAKLPSVSPGIEASRVGVSIERNWPICTPPERARLTEDELARR